MFNPWLINTQQIVRRLYCIILLQFLFVSKIYLQISFSLNFQFLLIDPKTGVTL